jgi:hypothetical protein
LPRNCLLQQDIEGKIKGEMEVTGRRGRRLGSYWMNLRKAEDISFEGGSFRSHYVGELVLEEALAYRETDC